MLHTRRGWSSRVALAVLLAGAGGVAQGCTSGASAGSDPECNGDCVAAKGAEIQTGPSGYVDGLSSPGGGGETTPFVGTFLVKPAPGAGATTSTDAVACTGTLLSCRTVITSRGCALSVQSSLAAGPVVFTTANPVTVDVPGRAAQVSSVTFMPEPAGPAVVSARAIALVRLKAPVTGAGFARAATEMPADLSTLQGASFGAPLKLPVNGGSTCPEPDGLRRVAYFGGFSVVTTDPNNGADLLGVDLFRTNTTLPVQTAEDFGMPLFKEPGTIVAIELGGRQDGSLSCANDNSFYATLPQHAAWIHSQIPDTDGDGTPDECDICPGTDDAQDTNNNGIPDCKDLCATATTPSGAACAAEVPNGDADCDGICDEQDNCPAVANTDQANCNAVSENAHGAKVLGDACDPVPCPMFEPQVASPSPACTYDAYKWSCLTKSTLTGLSFSPLGSFGTGEAPGSAAFGGVEVPVTVPSTRVRYCVDRLGVACDAKPNVSDELSQPSVGTETASSVYWRVSVDGDSPLVSGLPQRTYSATQPPEQISWDYDADFAAWQASNYPVPLLGVVSGTTHTGRLWFHADTSVGMAGGPADVTAKTGIHTKTDGSAGEQLANHYSSVFPSQLKLEAGAVDGPWPPIKVDVCIGAECNAVPNTPIKDCIACNVLSPALVAPRPGDLQLVVDIPGLGLHGLTEAGGYAPIANPGAVSAELGALLAVGGKQVTAVEPVRLVGRGTSVPQSLFLSTDGVRLLGGLTVLGDTVTTTQAARQLLLGGRRGEDATGATLGAWTPASVPDAVEIADGAPAPAAGVAGIPVYSAALGQLLLVRSGGGAAGAGELWRRDIRSPGGWQRVALGTTALGTVRAATYTYRDGAMWVLDEVRGPFGLKQARLLRVGLEGEGAKVMASWPKLGVYDAHWLLVDRDGGLVLVASSSKTLTHVAAKLQATGSGLHLSALRFAPGSLALPPVIDRNGFRFFVKRHKTDHLVETTRLASLAPATLPLSHVGGCF